MEKNYDQEESRSWYEEVDEEEHEKYKSSLVGRLHVCVFCRRGFNTAQALGGHMNIHRRERVRVRNKLLNSSNSKRQEANQYYAGLRIQHQTPASSCDQVADNHFVHHNHNLPCLSFSTYFPASASCTRSINKNNFPDQQDCSSCFDLQQPDSPLIRMSLSFECTKAPTSLEDSEKKRPNILSQKEELDLELRLGYDS